MRTFNKWTYEMCVECALKCSTKEEFKRLYSMQFRTSCEKGWLQEVYIAANLINVNKIHTKEKCLEYALKCSTKKEFKKWYINEYSAAVIRGWIDEICTHMKPLGNRESRGVYSYKIEFDGKKYGYSGLAKDFNERHLQHIGLSKYDNGVNIKKRNKTRVDTFCYINNIELPNMIIEHDYMYYIDAQIKEEENRIKLHNDGYIILNKNKCGGLGTIVIKHTKEKCIEAANKCKNNKEFVEMFPNECDASRRNGWFKEITQHFEELNHKWAKEECYIEFLKFNNSRQEFRNGNSKAYRASIYNNWLDDFFGESTMRTVDSWTYDECKEKALKCFSRTDFFEKYNKEYKASIINVWLDDFFPTNRKNKGYWDSYDNCKEAASKCIGRDQYNTLYTRAYRVASKNGWLNEFFCDKLKKQKKIGK